MRWHYTVGHCYQQILASGEIRPATANVPPGERPAVWFSTNPTWEQTACKGVIENGVRRTLPFEEMIEGGFSAFRFGVEPRRAPHDWDAFVRRSRIDRRLVPGLLKSAAEVGADHREWFVSFAPVAVDDCIAIEIWHEGAWVSVVDDA